MLWRLALVVCAVLMALLPLPSPPIERLYSNGLYRTIQPILTGASNRVPFALFDLLMAAVLLGWLGLAVRDVAGRRGRSRFAALGSITVRSIVLAAALYLVFLAVWGLNYRRVRLQDRLPFDRSAEMSDAGNTTPGNAFFQVVSTGSLSSKV